MWCPCITQKNYYRKIILVTTISGGLGVLPPFIHLQLVEYIIERIGVCCFTCVFLVLTIWNVDKELVASILKIPSQITLLPFCVATTSLVPFLLLQCINMNVV
jgi:hypothetical protein